ncbi:MAG: hypothetical protein AAF950_13330 [Pseudomonadota bacterium]
MAGKRAFSTLISLSLALVLEACSSQPRQANLNLIYKQAAQYHKPDRNPVIVIPGILGSALVEEDTDRVVWGAFRGSFADPRENDGAQLIALPIDEDKPLNELKDDVRPDGVLETLQVRLLGIPLDLRAYVGILSTLGVGGYADETLGLNGIDYGDDHFTCFQFDYDWRRDNVENAARLKAFIDVRRKYIQREYKKRYGIEDADIKFDIVAHSMGGLLARYYLRYGGEPLPGDGADPELTWAGAEDIEKLVLVGTPNGGASETLEQLITGYSRGRPVVPRYPAYIMGTFPSIYQLLPRPRQGRIIYDDPDASSVGDIYDQSLWSKFNWGLASDDIATLQFLSDALPGAANNAERQRIAEAFQAKALAQAKAFHRALDKPATPPDDVQLYLVAGDAYETPYKVTVNQDTGAPKVTQRGPGDGSVPRYSALADERIGREWRPYLASPIDWSGVTFLSSTHIGLTTDPAFADNVLYMLLEAPRPGRLTPEGTDGQTIEP